MLIRFTRAQNPSESVGTGRSDIGSRIRGGRGGGGETGFGDAARLFLACGAGFGSLFSKYVKKHMLVT